MRRNKGTAGIDGITIRQFERNLKQNLSELQQDLISGSYQPRPLKRILVPKAKGGLRPLGLWALRDRIAQRVVYDYLQPIFDPMFLNCSYGFRPGRSVAHAVEQVIQHRNANLRWVVDADIKKCFDNINPNLRGGEWASWGGGETTTATATAILQFRPLAPSQLAPSQLAPSPPRPLAPSQKAPLLCNIYLHELDVELSKQGFAVVRYADDFVTQSRRKQEAQEAYRAIQRALAPLRLQLHPDKTRLVHFDEGFKFLGYFFVRNNVYQL